MFLRPDNSVLCKYEGEWNMGKKHGQGTTSYPDGSIYAGESVDDLKHGFGRFIWPTNDEYTGNW